VRNRATKVGAAGSVLSIIITLVFGGACQNSLGSRADARSFIEDGLSGSLSYDANGGSGSLSASVLYAYGDRVAAADAGSLIKTGSFFGGWNTSADGSGRPYAAGDVIVMNQDDVILYAQWADTITENGLTFTVSGSTITDSQGVAYTLSDGTIVLNDHNTACAGRVTIPSAIGGYPVTSLPYQAFAGNTGLVAITLPESITSISASCFNSCSNLESVTLPDTLMTIEGNAFAYCNKLGSIVLPESLTTILLYAFHDCVGLTSVTLPAGLTTIGYGAFMGCTGLTTVTVKARTPPTINGNVFTYWSAYEALLQGF
jgi:hypothetical protein